MTHASIFLSFPLLSAYKSTKIRKSSRLKPKPAAPLHLPPAIQTSGGDATSYTRLPPKEDFQIDPSPFHDVIKLREVVVPPADSWSKNSSEPTNEVEDDDDEDDDVIFGVESDEVNVDVKEKGVPAVMRCFDRAKIYVKAGDGGDGVVAFRREKYVPFGGPSGGDGGKGGDVYVEVDGEMNSLLSFRKNVHFRAGRGGHGLGRKQAGGKGEDVVVKVAPGTVIRESWKGDGEEGVLLLELLKPGEKALLFRGGRGGRGNASFKSGMRKAPKIAENGEAGTEM